MRHKDCVHVQIVYFQSDNSSLSLYTYRRNQRYKNKSNLTKKKTKVFISFSRTLALGFWGHWFDFVGFFFNGFPHLPVCVRRSCELFSSLRPIILSCRAYWGSFYTHMRAIIWSSWKLHALSWFRAVTLKLPHYFSLLCTDNKDG